MANVDLARFDEANLRNTVTRYVSSQITLASQSHTIDSNTVVRLGGSDVPGASIACRPPTTIHVRGASSLALRYG
jgi:hypothetical protein